MIEIPMTRAVPRGGALGWLRCGDGGDVDHRAVRQLGQLDAGLVLIGSFLILHFNQKRLVGVILPRGNINRGR